MKIVLILSLVAVAAAWPQPPLPQLPGLPPLPDGPPILPGFITRRIEAIKKKIQNFCNGSKPTKCFCSEGEEGAFITPQNLSSPREIFKCKPNRCECEDGSNVELPDKIPRPDLPPFLKKRFEQIRDKVNKRVNMIKWINLLINNALSAIMTIGLFLLLQDNSSRVNSTPKRIVLGSWSLPR